MTEIVLMPRVKKYPSTQLINFHILRVKKYPSTQLINFHILRGPFRLVGFPLADFEIDKSEPFTAFLFFRKEARHAADLLMQELRSKKGKMTAREMGAFARSLASGRDGFRFSRRNFYNKVLRTFHDFCFIVKMPTYDEETKKTVMAYKAIPQYVPAKNPPIPSFLYIAYQISRWWDELMIIE